jgi:hypothetical protein
MICAFLIRIFAISRSLKTFFAFPPLARGGWGCVNHLNKNKYPENSFLKYYNYCQPISGHKNFVTFHLDFVTSCHRQCDKSPDVKHLQDVGHLRTNYRKTERTMIFHSQNLSPQSNAVYQLIKQSITPQNVTKIKSKNR